MPWVIELEISCSTYKGICNHIIKYLIYYFIEIKYYFDLEQLNSWIEQFDYSVTEIDDKPPATIFYSSADDEYHTKYSAAQMLCFVKYFGLIVGNVVPKNSS